jgi:hypothetical protein
MAHMLPPVNSPVWKKLVSGEKQLKSTNLVVNMLLTNCRVRYKSDPATLNELVQHTHGAFLKLEKTLESEISQLVS